MSSYKRLIFISVVVLTSIISCTSHDGDSNKDISLDEASQIVLDQVVRPDSLGEDTMPLIVFAWPDVLQPDDQMEAYRLSEMEEEGIIDTISSDVWFFWVDDDPAAKFAHPTRFVFVERISGEVTVVEDQWWPVLNGEGLWVETEDYWDEDNWIFSNLEWRRSTSSTSSSSVVQDALGVNLFPISYSAGRTHGLLSQPTSPDSAIVINGWKPRQTGKEDMETDADGMHDIFDDLGFDTTYLGPTEDDNPDRDGAADFGAINDWFSDKAKEMQPSQTLFVYITSHGMAKDGEGLVDGIPEGILDLWLEKFNPGVHIIVIIDSCNSGSFIDSLSDVADVTITATNGTMSAYFDYDPDNDPNKDDIGSEFTSGFIEDWNLILDDETKVERVREDAKWTGKNFWEALAEAAFWTAFEKDAAALNGFSLPLIEFGDASTKPSPIDKFNTYTASSSQVKETLRDSLISEGINDQIFCESDKEITNPKPETDINWYMALMAAFDEVIREVYFGNTLFPCDTLIDGVLTVCPEGAGPMPEGDILIMIMALATDVPLEDPDYTYIYSAVLDADGDPSNNFEYQPPWDWDYYQGTDRWYILSRDPFRGEWSMAVIDHAIERGAVPSNARAVIMGDLVIYFIPADEFSVERPGYRLTTFAFDDGISPDSSSGDVTGADPTEPLAEIPEEKVIIDSE